MLSDFRQVLPLVYRSCQQGVGVNQSLMLLAFPKPFFCVTASCTCVLQRNAWQNSPRKKTDIGQKLSISEKYRPTIVQAR